MSTPTARPGMSLNDVCDFRKMVPVDEGVVQQVRQIAFDHMKNVRGQRRRGHQQGHPGLHHVPGTGTAAKCVLDAE